MQNAQVRTYPALRAKNTTHIRNVCPLCEKLTIYHHRKLTGLETLYQSFSLRLLCVSCYETRVHSSTSEGCSHIRNMIQVDTEDQSGFPVS
jgi:hypothetical protein